MAKRNTPSGGAKPDKIMRDALLRAINREETVKVDGKSKKLKRVEIIADQLAKLACDGNLTAIGEIYDRVDGRATQPVDHGGTLLESWLAALPSRA